MAHWQAAPRTISPMTTSRGHQQEARPSSDDDCVSPASPLTLDLSSLGREEDPRWPHSQNSPFPNFQSSFGPPRETARDKHEALSPQSWKSSPQSFKPAKTFSIPRKPVATYSSIQECPGDQSDGASQPPSYISETSAEKTRTTARGRSLWRIWALELICIALSIILFIVIVVVLSKFDQQSLPNWPWGITLNSFVAFFTTLTKAAFIVPVSVAISQTQWTWFNQEKPQSLYDFHVIDQASRGAWGSLVLIWRFRFRHVVALGALLVIISTVTAPVTQLSIDYPIRDTLVAGEEAVTKAVFDVRAPRDELYRATQQAIYMGSLLDFTGFLRPLSFADITTGRATCSTGNCTFNQYQSLGVCVKMANISSHLTVEEFANSSMLETPVMGESIRAVPDLKVYRASLGGGLDMAHYNNLAVYAEMLNGNLTFAFGDDPALQRARIASFAVMYTTPTVYNDTWWGSKKNDAPSVKELVNNIGEFRHDATEVLFHLCAQTYETEVRTGVEATRVVESFTDMELIEPVGGSFLDMNCSSFLYEQSSICQTRQDRWEEVLELKVASNASSAPDGLSSGSTQSFTANYLGLEDMAGTMKSYLVGYASVSPDTEIDEDTPIIYAGGEFVRRLHQSVLFALHDNLENRQAALSNIYTNIATSLSALIRVGQPTTFAHAAFNVTGEAWKEASYVRITWGWISLLATEIAIAIVFLALTIANQVRRGELNDDEPGPVRDLKDSSLGPMVALSRDCHSAAGGGLRPIGELKQAAKEVRVRLEGRQIVLADEPVDGWREVREGP